MDASTSNNLYRASPRKIREYVLDCLFAGLVPLILSSPGMGKSSIVRSIANYLNLKLIDHRLSTSEPTDLSGLPQFVDGLARFAPFAELFPIEGTPLPEGKEGWLIFLDELNSAPRGVIAAAYKLILDQMVGQQRLHEKVVIVAAGNLATDKAIVNPIGTAMQSRVITLEMEISFEDWLQDVALPEKYDSRLIAYLSQYPSRLMDFRPDHSEKTFCCPRTWEFMNKLIKGKPVTEDKAPLYAGTITSGVAVDFIEFTQVFQNLVTIKMIQNDPSGCPLPTDNSTRWATIAHMMEKVDAKNFTDLCTYADRFGLDFRILFYRSVQAQHPELRQHPAFGKAMVGLTRYLNAA